MTAYLTLIDHGGQLAAAFPPSPDWHRPILEQFIYLSDSIRADRYPGLIGARVSSDTTQVYDRITGAYRAVRWLDWTPITIEMTIPKPRDGREHTWHYAMGQWRRLDFPQCGECRKWHNPSHVYCEGCGVCYGPNQVKRHVTHTLEAVS
jgi:hypothetical protein